MEQICRLCGEKKARLRSIFLEYEEENLLDIIKEVLRVEISEDDGLPSQVCKPCASALLKIQESIVKYREIDKSLRKRLLKQEDGTEPPETDTPDTGTPNVGAFFVEVKMEQDKSSDESEAYEPPDDDNDDDDDESSSDSDEEYVARKPSKKEKPNNAPVLTASGLVRRPPKRKRRDPNPKGPKLNDNKCYICRSDTLGSPKALLEHLANSHLSMMPHTCTECVMETVVLKTVKALNVHKRMHAQPIKCEYCDRRYSSLTGRDLHVKTFHLGENAPCPSPCEKCGKICKSQSALRSHLRDHKSEVKCPICEKIFYRNDRLKIHLINFHEKGENTEKHECTICGHMNSTLEAYNIHLNTHKQVETYTCDLCPKKFFTAGNLRSHKKVHVKNANYKPKKDWTSHYTVHEHPEKGKSFTCNHCQKTFTGIINTVISHVKCHFKEIKCDQCSLTFSEAHKLKLHYVVHTRERNYKCPHCSKDFMYSSHRIQHIKQAHASEAEVAERIAAGYAAKAAKAAAKAFNNQ